MCSVYRRDLDLDKAIGTVGYAIDGVTYVRESFAAYPDRCFVSWITASKPGKVSFRLKALHPYLGATRSGTAQADGNTLILKGDTPPYHLKYEVRIEVKTQGGTSTASASGEEGAIVVDGADGAVVFVTLGTNYQLDSKVFLTGRAEQKLEGRDGPTEEIKATLASAQKSGWDVLKNRHVADVGGLMQRTRIDLGGQDPAVPTDRLLADPNPTSSAARYLEELYFQYGRYLLISSSRKGTLPPNLQGTWNMNANAPWTGGILGEHQRPDELLARVLHRA